MLQEMLRDNSHLDYTIDLEVNGKTYTYRNPGEKDGALTDKNHTFPSGAILKKFGTSHWNWKERTVQEVGIDVDTGNHGKLTEDEFQKILDSLMLVPWLRLVRSKGGSGIHAYAMLSEPVEITTRKHQAALGNAVCVAASRIAAIDVKDAKCCAGGNMWIYADQAAPNAFEVIKEATATLDPSELPPGWREVSKAAKIDFAQAEVELETEHLEIEKQIADTGYPIIYQSDLNCWHIHTKGLEVVSKEHGYKGYFVTNSEGSDKSKPNGYMFPLPGGGFVVFRFGNAQEHESWYNGKYAYLNVVAPYKKALEHFSNAETTKGYVFSAEGLNAFFEAIEKPPRCSDQFGGRSIIVKVSKSKISFSVEHQEADEPVEGWVKNGKFWQRSINTPSAPPAVTAANVLRASQRVRAVATDAESSKWSYKKDDGEWARTTTGDVTDILVSQSIPPKVVKGELRLKPYTLVSLPSQPEHLPGRRWNVNCAQYACQPADEAGDTPTWDRVWEHMGSSLDDGIIEDEDCQRVGIDDGAHYLRLWFSLMLRHPLQRLPYLFFFSGPQRRGKSSLGLAAKYLINPGVGEVTKEAFIDKFTGELEGKVLCLIEEIDLNRGGAYQRIKNLATNPEIPIRKMHMDTYRVPNSSHFIHTANDPYFVPVESEDMRSVIGEVAALKDPIPNDVFLAGLEAEAPFMLRKLVDIELPESCDPRFWLPVLQTPIKEQIIVGVYGDGPSDAEKSVKKFAEMRLSVGGYIPRDKAWGEYQQFMTTRPDVVPVHRNRFLPALQKQSRLEVGTKQRRVKGKRIWCYEGISLNA